MDYSVRCLSVGCRSGRLPTSPSSKTLGRKRSSTRRVTRPFGCFSPFSVRSVSGLSLHFVAYVFYTLFRFISFLPFLFAIFFAGAVVVDPDVAVFKVKKALLDASRDPNFRPQRAERMPCRLFPRELSLHFVSYVCLFVFRSPFHIHIFPSVLYFLGRRGGRFRRHRLQSEEGAPRRVARSEHSAATRRDHDDRVGGGCHLSDALLSLRSGRSGAPTRRVAPKAIDAIRL